MRRTEAIQQLKKFTGGMENGTPDAVIALIKECANRKDLTEGNKTHENICKNAILKSNMFVINTLISMYAKCGALSDAQAVFEELPFADVVSWNALIAGYNQYGNDDEVFRHFEQMKLHGSLPNAVTYVFMLKASARLQLLCKGQMMHVQIIGGSLKNNEFISNGLVDMYSKCGFLAKSKEVFDDLSFHSLVSWNVLISGYTQHGFGKEALNCLECMKGQSFLPDEFTITCILKACGSMGALEKGQEIHAEIVNNCMFCKDLMTGNALVDMYARCGVLVKANEVFDNLCFRDVVSCNALIAGYSQQGHGEEASRIFKQMQSEGICPNAVTYLCMMKCCSSLKILVNCHKIHAQVAVKRLQVEHALIGNALIDMYIKCGLIENAHRVFYELPIKNTITWNTLIAGYARQGYSEDALNCFELMQLNGLSPDTITFVCILKACGNVGVLEKGKAIHTQIVKLGLVEENNAIGTALLCMYAKSGALIKAQEVFNSLQPQTVISWNTLISGYVQHGDYEEALNHFNLMQSRGLPPDAMTFVCILKAFSSLELLEKGQEIHFEACRQGVLNESEILGTTLVDMYAKCGAFMKAHEVLDELMVQNTYSWNALIARYSAREYHEEVLSCFRQMQFGGICPDTVTFICLLKTCGSLGMIAMGQEIHIQVIKQGSSVEEVVIGNALVDMYANSGAVSEAQAVFDRLSVRDAVTWTSLISGYSQIGEREIAFQSMQELFTECESLDTVSCMILLNDCRHKGLIEMGFLCIWMMDVHYGISPCLEEHTCMIDLLGRAGQLDQALALVQDMPFSGDAIVWLTLLGACLKWGNVEIGILAFDHAIELDEKNAAAYIYMSNIYLCAGRQDDANKIGIHRLESKTLTCQFRLEQSFDDHKSCHS